MVLIRADPRSSAAYLFVFATDLHGFTLMESKEKRLAILS